MLFARVDGKKVEASPKMTGICSFCEKTVFSKCGEINVWHWAHQKDESCDSWYEPETEWHKNWKLAFGIRNCEIAINKDGIRHIADIVTTNNVIIELQNSPIQKSVIRDREVFYGEQMMWVINGNHFKENYSIYKSQLDEDADYYRFHNPASSEYGQVNSSRKNEYCFSWTRYRKSWFQVQRHIFIDFGNENLFKVTEGIGTKYGKGKQIAKANFLKKYGGDLKLLSTLIVN